jgi:hypothetical protein
MDGQSLNSLLSEQIVKRPLLQRIAAQIGELDDTRRAAETATC